MSRLSSISVDDLEKTAASYERLLRKAIKLSSPSDIAAIQRLGAGLNALTKAMSTSKKLRGETGRSNASVGVCYIPD